MKNFTLPSLACIIALLMEPCRASYFFSGPKGNGLSDDVFRIGEDNIHSYPNFVCSPFDDDIFYFPDDDEASATQHHDFLDSLCKILDVYDNSVRFSREMASKESWSTKCREFDPVDELLCPTEACVENYFCGSRFVPHLNPTVRAQYCEPFFGLIEDEDRRKKCTDHCVNYVSLDRGACCGVWRCNRDE